MEFQEFPKLARFSREIIITEKIDGTNSQIFIDEELNIKAGSRNRWICPQEDNFGFAKWVVEHECELQALGPGRHFGEWWGSGIQRGYGLKNNDKRFSLFNTTRWEIERPSCCEVVPILYRGSFDTSEINKVFENLRNEGSKASLGFMKPEGIVVFHIAANVGFKKTFDKDDASKWEIK